MTSSLSTTMHTSSEWLTESKRGEDKLYLLCLWKCQNGFCKFTIISFVLLHSSQYNGFPSSPSMQLSSFTSSLTLTFWFHSPYTEEGYLNTRETYGYMKTQLTPALRLSLGLSFFAFILIGANDGAVGVLLPSMGTTYHVDKATLGLLFLAGTAGYFLASFNNGLLLEKLGNQRFLLLGTALDLLGMAILSSKPSFVILLLAIVPIGFGGAMLDAGLNSYIAGLPRNTALLNYLHAFYGTGALLGPLVASAFLAAQFGWNTVYFVWIGMAFVLLLGVGVAFRREQMSAHKEETKAEGNLLVTTLRVRAVWIAALFLLFYVGTEVSLGSWSYSFLTETRHGSTLLSGWTVSGYWLGLTLGRLSLGHVAARIGDKHLIQYCLTGVVIGVLLIWLVPNTIVSACGFCLTGFSLGPIFPTTIALMSHLVSSRILPSAIGFLASLGSMGAALFPWIAGNIAQHLGLWSLLPYVIFLTAIMLILWLMLQRPQRAM